MLANTAMKRREAISALKALSHTKRSEPLITPRYSPPIQRKAMLMAMICTARITSLIGSSLTFSQRLAITSANSQRPQPPSSAMLAKIRLRARNSCR
ncbi:hypothetical protein D3C78_1606070 [compost metagenome]